MVNQEGLPQYQKEMAMWKEQTVHCLWTLARVRSSSLISMAFILTFFFAPAFCNVQVTSVPEQIKLQPQRTTFQVCCLSKYSSVLALEKKISKYMTCEVDADHRSVNIAVIVTGQCYLRRRRICFFGWGGETSLANLNCKLKIVQSG